MNKLFILCGMVFLGITSTPQEDNSNDLTPNNELYSIGFTADLDYLATNFLAPEVFYSNAALESGLLPLSAIPYAELEEEVYLGFDTAAYLPDNFDPAAGLLDLKTISYLEMENFEELGFKTEEYLPASFDPYAIPTNFMDISFIEGEEEIDLGFDTKQFLPRGYNAYEIEFDLDSILFIEEEDLKFGYDTTKYAI